MIYARDCFSKFTTEWLGSIISTDQDILLTFENLPLVRLTSVHQVFYRPTPLLQHKLLEQFITIPTEDISDYLEGCPIEFPSKD